MSENEGGLDMFLASGDSASEKQEAADNNDASIEDEFIKLLNDFINQDAPKKEPEDDDSESLDDLYSSSDDALDGMVTDDSQEESYGLDGMVTDDNQESSGLDGFVTSSSDGGGLDDMLSGGDTSSEEGGENADNIKSEEQELARAISNFQDGVNAIAEKKNMVAPSTDYNEEQLKPNYKPSVGKRIAEYLLECWDLINKYDPENMKRLSKDATDEDYLTFAETLNDTDLQLAVISYVEILINIEICETSYEQKLEILKKNRIKRELYEEYMELQERKKLFIQKIKEKNFPIDADRLMNNYFRAAQKDAEGAFNALVKNPATFAPIQVERIKPKFFGLIKVSPDDGKKANRKIGEFIKKIKV